jgi:hypothetical protein
MFETWLLLNLYHRCRDEALILNLLISNAYEWTSYYARVSRKVVVEIVFYFI